MKWISNSVKIIQRLDTFSVPGIIIGYKDGHKYVDDRRNGNNA